VLGDRERFAGESRLVGLERPGAGHAHVGCDAVSLADDQHVARNDAFGGNRSFRTIAHDERRLRECLGERADRALGSRFLPEAEHAVEHDDRPDRCSFDGVADRDRDRGRRQQQRHQRVEQLAEREAHVRRPPRRPGPIRAVTGEACRHLDRAEAALEIGREWLTHGDFHHHQHPSSG